MFDEYQNSVISANEDKVLLVASPGSGKTTVIIHKLISLINEGVNGDNILLITFTRKACDNMKSRFSEKHISLTMPHFYTFHSLFYKVIRENISLDINIITENMVKDFFGDILRSYVDVVTDYKIQSIICEITRLNKSNQSIDKFNTTFPRDILLNIYNHYKVFKDRNNLMDFDDISNKVLELFKNDECVLAKYRNRFKYILVDEFQDCDNVQFEILRMMGRDSKLLCVGDEDQSIYQFRGANPSIMVNFCDVFDGAKKYYLKYNYRSKHSIINFSRNVIENNKLRNKKQLIGRKVEEGEVICKNFMEDIDQGSYIVDDIQYNLRNGCNLSDFAVLYRNHNDSFSILSEFIKRNIKINFLDNSFNIFEQFYIKDLINLLLFIDSPNVNNFRNIYNKVTLLFSRRIIHILNKFDYSLNIFDVVSWNFDKFSYSDRRSIYKLESLVKKLRKYGIDSRLNGVLNKLGYSTYLDNVIKQKNLNKNEIDYFIRYFYNLVIKFNSIEEFQRDINSINSIQGVNFGTIHSSKGMEFRCVYIINAQEVGNGGINTNINVFYDEEEERRIFYVGITRAIDSLRILSPYFINGRFNKDPLKFVREGLGDESYGKLNEDNIKKVSKNKVLLYFNGKEKKLEGSNYFELT